MNVLSLFDGMSSGQIALTKIGITIDNYYASEIDKYAIKVTQDNFPNTIQLGDVTKWKEWGINWSSIDLVTGGFPCQAWSLAGKQLGDKDSRGMLFWTMLDIVKTVLDANPNAKFLIENVKMKKEFEQYITHHTEKALGKVEKHLINSSLVSAQNRQRYYWTNIPNVSQPEDKKIYLKDIIENGLVDRDKSYCIDANYFKGTNLAQYLKKSRRQVVFGRIVGRRLDDDGVRKDEDKSIPAIQRLEVNKNPEKSNTLTTVQKDNVILGSGLYCGEYCIRKLTVLECKRLQTVPDEYKMDVSKTQSYKMLGNGWTVDVISHIFKGLK